MTRHVVAHTVAALAGVVALLCVPYVVEAQALPAGGRVVVLEPGGDVRLARALGRAARARASAAVGAHGLVPTLGPRQCADPDCASELLAGGRGDYALAIALWGRTPTVERVAVTLLDARGGAHGAEVVVSAGDVDAAVDGAVAAALAQLVSGGLSELSVIGSPEGATITLDQAPWGTVPHTDTVSRGDHALAVSAEGFDTERRVVTVGTGPLTVELALSPAARMPVGAPMAAPVAAEAAASPVEEIPREGGPDPLLLGLGTGVGGLGLSLAGLGVYALAAPGVESLSSDVVHARSSLEAAGAVLGVSVALLTAGVVLVVLGATSPPPAARPATGARNPRRTPQELH